MGQWYSFEIIAKKLRRTRKECYVVSWNWRSTWDETCFFIHSFVFNPNAAAGDQNSRGISVDINHPTKFFRISETFGANFPTELYKAADMVMAPSDNSNSFQNCMHEFLCLRIGCINFAGAMSYQWALNRVTHSGLFHLLSPVLQNLFSNFLKTILWVLSDIFGRIG